MYGRGIWFFSTHTSKERQRLNNWTQWALYEQMCSCGLLFFSPVLFFGLDNVHLSETRPFIHTDGKQVPAADDWCLKCQWNLMEMVSRTWKKAEKRKHLEDYTKESSWIILANFPKRRRRKIYKIVAHCMNKLFSLPNEKCNIYKDNVITCLEIWFGAMNLNQSQMVYLCLSFAFFLHLSYFKLKNMV